MRPPATPGSSLVVIALVVAAALGVCAVAAAVMAPIALNWVDAWLLAGAGLVVLLGSLFALWVIQRRRDSTLW